MIERVIEYLVNALWQLPLLALGAWWLLRAVRPGPLTQYRVWVAVLGLAVVLPLARVGRVVTTPLTEPVRQRTAASQSETALALPGPMAWQGVVTASQARDNVAQPVRFAARRWRSWTVPIPRRRSLKIGLAAARWLAGIYGLTILLGLLRVVRSWRAARRLVRQGRQIQLQGSARELLEDCGRRLGVRLPEMVESGEVSSPAVVGAARAVLLVPEFFAGCGQDEVRAALLHEMAHIRRRDYAANFVAEIAALPLAWHPVMHAVQSRLRSTREMVCDAMAAGELGSQVRYARALLTLASGAVGNEFGMQAGAVGLFTNNNLEERMMQLTVTEQTLSARARAIRVVSAVAGMAAVAAFAMMVHVTPTMAQQVTTVLQPAGVSEKDAAAIDAVKPLTVQDVALTPMHSGQGVARGGISDGKGGSAGGGASGTGPLAMAHGTKATLAPAEGEFLHEWTAEDGEPFKVLTKEQAEPSAAEKKLDEERLRRQMADMDRQIEQMKLNLPELRVEMADAKKQLAEAKVQMDSPELRKQLAEMNRPRLTEQMAELNRQKLRSALDSARLQKQLSVLSSPEFQKHLSQQMAALQTQSALSKLNSVDMQKRLEKLDSPEFQKHLEERIREQVKREIRAQVELQIQKQAEEEIETVATPEPRPKPRTEAKPPCAEPCSAVPQ